MLPAAVHNDRGRSLEPEATPGPMLRLLLRRSGLVLVAASVLTVLAGMAGSDAGDKLTSGAYLDTAAESQRAAALLTQEFPGGPPNLVLIANTPTGTVDSPTAEESGRELTKGGRVSASPLFGHIYTARSA